VGSARLASVAMATGLLPTYFKLSRYAVSASKLSESIWTVGM
jgi:hypothetical protein